MWLYYYIIWFRVYNFFVEDITQSTAVIKTTLGPVQGEILKTISKGVEYSSFKGIRYAKPPIGRLRFKPPSFANPWTEVVSATVRGSRCPQIDLGLNEAPIGDEDCLFVNVFSPVTDLSKSPSELKAVMVWIYGGGFSTGGSETESYGPDFLIENDVVVVSFNYRVGPLGFLSLNHPEAMGNAGLKDQQLALKWVQQNVEKFHGDPRRVTIFGESAGGASVLYHTLSDQSQGLFHGVISISGSPLNPFAFVKSSQMQKTVTMLANLLGRNTTDKKQLLATFYRASAYDLVLYASQLGSIDPPFGPVLEDISISTDSTAFLSTCVVKKYESRNFSQVPHMLGFNNDETLAFTREPLLSELKSECKKFANKTNSTFAIPSAYSLQDGEWSWPLVEETTDIMFKAGIEITQRYVTAHSKQPVYYYNFIFASDKNPLHSQLFGVSEVGAGHTDILRYIWYTSRTITTLDPEDPTSITREKVTRMLTNFAKYGNPTPDGKNDPLLNIEWPDYGSSHIYLDIGYDLSLGRLNYNENTEKIIEASEPFLATANDCSTN